jgi:predicted RNase H-like nuclease (RuvC/YqgF family)
MPVSCKVKDGSILQFYPFVVNKYTNTPAHSGFTQITEEQYAFLKESSNLFKDYVAKKKLVVHDKLPNSLKTPAQVLATKDREIKELKAKLESLEESGVSAALEKDISEKDSYIKVLEGDIKSRDKDMAALKKENELLQKQLAAK